MADHESAAKLAMFAIRAKNNHDAVLYFIGAMASIAFIIIFAHSLQNIAIKMSTKGRSGPSALVAVARKVKSISVARVPGLPSVGHATVVVLYLITNLVLMFAHINNEIMPLLPNFASRTGWLAICNLLVVVFLALKNTPLAFLISCSYERLNVLHRVAGTTTLVLVILHASCYSAYFVGAGRPTRLLEMEEIFGMVAGLSFLVLFVSGAVIRAWWYELFYYMHVSFWMLAIVMVGLHQPEVSKKILFGTCVAGGIWGLDRLIRLVRIAMYSISNQVVLHPLPNGGTRVVLKKAPFGATSGKHCFLWIPNIRACEMHPFTIAAADPVEFVINSYDGFTDDLHQFACKNPGVALRASIDGPYGSFPSPSDCDKMVLVAGGSGASFTFGAALNALRKMTAEDKKHLIFVWIVKHYSQLKWFSQHIRTLEADDRVSVHLHVTRPSAMAEVSQSSSDEPSDKIKPKVSVRADDLEKSGPSTLARHFFTDSEKGNQTDVDGPSVQDDEVTDISSTRILHERPDVSVLIQKVVEETPRDQRILIMGCGPDGLTRAVRDTSAQCIRADGPAVDVHCEQFGW